MYTKALRSKEIDTNGKANMTRCSKLVSLEKRLQKPSVLISQLFQTLKIISTKMFFKSGLSCWQHALGASLPGFLTLPVFNHWGPHPSWPTSDTCFPLGPTLRDSPVGPLMSLTPSLQNQDSGQWLSSCSHVAIPSSSCSHPDMTAAYLVLSKAPAFLVVHSYTYTCNNPLYIHRRLACHWRNASLTFYFHVCVLGWES